MNEIDGLVISLLRCRLILCMKCQYNDTNGLQIILKLFLATYLNDCQFFSNCRKIFINSSKQRIWHCLRGMPWCRRISYEWYMDANRIAMNTMRVEWYKKLLCLSSKGKIINKNIQCLSLSLDALRSDWGILPPTTHHWREMPAILKDLYWGLEKGMRKK